MNEMKLEAWAPAAPDIRAVLSRSENFRRVREDSVRRYAADMIAGRWKNNGETLKFSHDGKLLDGQHRLLASIRAQAQGLPPIEFTVLRNVALSAVETLDAGRSRTAADWIRLERVPNVNACASVARFLAYAERSGWGSMSGNADLSQGDVLRSFRSNRDAITTACSVVHLTAGNRARRPCTYFLMIARALIRGHAPSVCEEFSRQVAGCEGYGKVLAQRFAAERARAALAPAAHYVTWSVKAFNGFIAHDAPSVLRLQATESVPDIINPEVYS